MRDQKSHRRRKKNGSTEVKSVDMSHLDRTLLIQAMIVWIVMTQLDPGHLSRNVLLKNFPQFQAVKRSRLQSL